MGWDGVWWQRRPRGSGGNGADRKGGVPVLQKLELVLMLVLVLVLVLLLETA